MADDEDIDPKRKGEGSEVMSEWDEFKIRAKVYLTEAATGGAYGAVFGGLAGAALPVGGAVMGGGALVAAGGWWSALAGAAALVVPGVSDVGQAVMDPVIAKVSEKAVSWGVQGAKWAAMGYGGFKFLNAGDKADEAVEEERDKRLAAARRKGTRQRQVAALKRRKEMQQYAMQDMEQDHGLPSMAQGRGRRGAGAEVG